MFNKLVCAIITFFTLFCEFSVAYDAFPPWNFTRHETSALSRDEHSMPAVILKDGVMLFSKYISPVDGDRCSMYPTCASYSREAIEKHGFLYGILLTVDRLIHEGNEINAAPLIKVYDRLRYLDPVSNNDFWWQ